MPLVIGDHILVSLNILGTCLEHDPGYDPFFGFPFISNSCILMTIDAINQLTNALINVSVILSNRKLLCI